MQEFLLKLLNHFDLLFRLSNCAQDTIYLGMEDTRLHEDIFIVPSLLHPRPPRAFQELWPVELFPLYYLLIYLLSLSLVAIEMV